MQGARLHRVHLFKSESERPERRYVLPRRTAGAQRHRVLISDKCLRENRARWVTEFIWNIYISSWLWGSLVRLEDPFAFYVLLCFVFHESIMSTDTRLNRLVFVILILNLGDNSERKTKSRVKQLSLSRGSWGWRHRGFCNRKFRLRTLFQRKSSQKTVEKPRTMPWRHSRPENLNLIWFWFLYSTNFYFLVYF